MAKPSTATLKRRDPADIERALAAWLADRLDAAGAPAITRLELPSGAGYSNETYLFDAEYAPAAGQPLRTESFVLQAAPVGEALFQTYDLRKVFELQTALGTRGVPVAPMRWYEPSAGLLGAPFYVMDRVGGSVPADRPSYHAEGFLTELEPDTRERMWWSGLSAMAQVHALDPRTVGVDLGSLDDPVGARLEHWTQFVAWASPDRLPYFDEAMQWLRRNRPYPQAPPSIVWGDAKLSNILFEDGQARALLDWELCTVGPAEDDLAHWLWLDHHSAVGARVARLPGLPDRQQTEAWYAGKLGRELEAPEWWWVYAIVRLQAVVHRIMHQLRALGGLPPETDIGQANSVNHIVRDLLQELA
ncbi:MAG TPA: phosphotransferase family protein [Frankiaceae bacterium]|jgi:aminoglycoside phosphotransferase (APT) family kinase protein|nr:phosphotransferase family protein [Frankiaceae bacterium]